MGILTIVVLALTAIALGFGALWGCGRGLYRATLRVGLVLFSVILAILLRGVFVDKIMSIEIKGATIKETLAEAFSGESDMPASLANLIMALAESVLSVVAFIALFFGLRIVTWIIVYPICKIWVKKGSVIKDEEAQTYQEAVDAGFVGTEEEWAQQQAEKRVKYKKRRGYGALVGLGQGILCAFVVLSPMTGMLQQVDKISKIEMEGKPLFEMPAEIGIDKYVESVPGKVYGKLGGWFFDTVATVKDEDGKKVNIGSAVDAVDAVMGVVESIGDLTEHFEILSSETSTDQERLDSLTALGEGLEKAGNALDNLDKDSKQMLEDLIGSVKDMIASEGDVDPEMEEILNNLSLDNLDLTAAGKALQGISTLLEVVETGSSETITQSEVNDIVNGIAKNPLLLDMVGSADGDVEFIDANDEDLVEYKAMFESAVENAELADEADRVILRAFFGLN